MMIQIISKNSVLYYGLENLDKIENGEPVDEPIFIALADVLKKFPVQLDNLRELISGMEDDLYSSQYQTLRGPQTILLPSCIDSRTLFGGNIWI